MVHLVIYGDSGVIIKLGHNRYTLKAPNCNAVSILERFSTHLSIDSGAIHRQGNSLWLVAR